MRLRRGLAAIDRDPAHLRSRQHVARGACTEDADEKGGDARPERGVKARNPAEIFGKNSGLLLRRFGHLLEQRGLGRVTLPARNRTRKIGGGLFRAPPLKTPCH
jgi:hypothetical protein